MKNTITTSSQATSNYLVASENIMMFMNELGFTSEVKHDPEMIKHTIAQFIREAIEPNVSRGYDVMGNSVVEEPSCCGDACDEVDGLDAMIRQIETERHHGCHCGCQCSDESES